jgi:hypothetical protein
VDGRYATTTSNALRQEVLPQEKAIHNTDICTNYEEKFVAATEKLQDAKEQ